MDFNEFLTSKKIEHTAFQKTDPELYQKLKTEYITLGKLNFDFSKKFLFNKMRLLYPIKNHE